MPPNRRAPVRLSKTDDDASDTSVFASDLAPSKARLGCLLQVDAGLFSSIDTSTAPVVDTSDGPPSSVTDKSEDSPTSLHETDGSPASMSKRGKDSLSSTSEKRVTFKADMKADGHPEHGERSMEALPDTPLLPSMDCITAIASDNVNTGYFTLPLATLFKECKRIATKIEAAGPLQDDKHYTVRIDNTYYTTFDTFVEFLRSNMYKPRRTKIPGLTSVHDDGFCWNLGKRIGCLRFSEAALQRLYDYFILSGRYSISDQDKVFIKSLVEFFVIEMPIGCPIRRLYFDVLASMMTRERAEQLGSVTMGNKNISLGDQAKWEDFSRAMWESAKIEDRATILKPIDAYSGFKCTTEYTREWPPRTSTTDTLHAGTSRTRKQHFREHTNQVSVKKAATPSRSSPKSEEDCEPHNSAYCQSEQLTAIIDHNSETKGYLWLYGETEAELIINGKRRFVQCGSRAANLVMTDVIDVELSPGWVWVYIDCVDPRPRRTKHPEMTEEDVDNALEAAQRANNADVTQGRVVCTVVLKDPPSEKALRGVTMQERLAQLPSERLLQPEHDAARNSDQTILPTRTELETMTQSQLRQLCGIWRRLSTPQRAKLWNRVDTMLDVQYQLWDGLTRKEQQALVGYLNAQAMGEEFYCNDVLKHQFEEQSAMPNALLEAEGVEDEWNELVDGLRRSILTEQKDRGDHSGDEDMRVDSGVGSLSDARSEQSVDDEHPQGRPSGLAELYRILGLQDRADKTEEAQCSEITVAPGEAVIWVVPPKDSCPTCGRPD